MAEDKKNEGKIIMEAQVHCKSTEDKVRKAILGYPGVEDISIDLKSKKVTLKAPSVNAKKFFDEVKKRSGGRITKLIHPDPKELEKKEKEEKEKKKNEEKKPVDVTVVLKVHNHCEDCKKKMEKIVWNIKDVFGVKVDGDKVTIQGKDLDPKKVCDQVKKKLRKHVEIVPPKKEDDKGSSGANKQITSGTDTKHYTHVVILNDSYAYPPQYFSDENPNGCAIM